MKVYIILPMIPSCLFFKTVTASKYLKSRCPFTEKPRQKDRDHSKIGNAVTSK